MCHIEELVVEEFVFGGISSSFLPRIGEHGYVVMCTKEMTLGHWMMF